MAAAAVAAVGDAATALVLGVGPSLGAVSGYDVRCRCALDADWFTCGSADVSVAAVLYGVGETVEVATTSALRWGMRYRLSARGRNSAGPGAWGAEAEAETVPAPQSSFNQRDGGGGGALGVSAELHAFTLLSADKAAEVASSSLL